MGPSLKPLCKIFYSKDKGGPVEEHLYKMTSKYSKFEFSLPNSNGSKLSLHFSRSSGLLIPLSYLIPTVIGLSLRLFNKLLVPLLQKSK